MSAIIHRWNSLGPNRHRCRHAEEARTRLDFGQDPLLVRTLHLAVNRSLPDAESIISRFDAELRGMVADRSYHRLLQVEWIEADVDGDGLAEYVPADDQAGPDEPIRAYELRSIVWPVEERVRSPRFFMGGNVYQGWSTVPQSYKVLAAKKARGETWGGRKKGQRYRLTPEKLQAVKGLLTEGLSKAEIARQLRIARSTVYEGITLLV